MGDRHGSAGVWACFERLVDEGQAGLAISNTRNRIREETVTVACEHDRRVEYLLGLFVRLRTLKRTWPNFYVDIIQNLILRGEYTRATHWHSRIWYTISPSREALAELISRLAHENDPELQQCLVSIYHSSDERGIFDLVIPSLYASGKEKLARTWRAEFTKAGDFPQSKNSLPFLRFLSCYYSRVYLYPQELELLGDGIWWVARDEPATESLEDGANSQGAFRRELVAKTFASRWISVDFAINLITQFGIPNIGPRELQALALREEDAQGVLERIKRLESLGIRLSKHPYCKVVAVMARKDDDYHLNLLLHSTIHYETLVNPQERGDLLAKANQDGDKDTSSLLLRIQEILDNKGEVWELNNLLRTSLKEGNLARSSLVLDRMRAVGVVPRQDNVTEMLRQLCSTLPWHTPTPDGLRTFRNQSSRKRPAAASSLDDVVRILRTCAQYDIAIPISCWSHALHRLGRDGRMQELIQLCLEFISRCQPVKPCLIPVYRDDVPRHQLPERRKDALPDNHELRIWETGQTVSTQAFGVVERQWIPSELPLNHPHHPVTKLVTPELQRRIVRWGIQAAIGRKRSSVIERSRGLEVTDLALDGIMSYDLAQGVRTLAILRDRGVAIEEALIAKAICRRMALAESSSYRHKQRSRQEISPEHVKAAVDSAWGTELLPPLSQFSRLVDQHKLIVWNQFPTLFRRQYDGLRPAEAQDKPLLRRSKLGKPELLLWQKKRQRNLVRR